MSADERPQDAPNGAANGAAAPPIFDFGPQVGQALQGGLSALEKLLGGFVQMAEKLAGPEGMKNLSAGQWLGKVAATLEAAAGPSPPPGTSGELEFHLKHLAAEVSGSKFAGDEPAMRSRLEGAQAIIARRVDSGPIDPADARTLVEAAGFFRAAAGSALPIGVPEGVTVTMNPGTPGHST